MPTACTHDIEHWVSLYGASRLTGESRLTLAVRALRGDLRYTTCCRTVYLDRAQVEHIAIGNGQLARAS
jgi:hypothetical protein